MPFKPNERLYRSFAASNFKPVASEETFDEDGNVVEQSEPTYKVRGYYTTFSSEYLLYERTKYWPAEYEQIDPHALDECDMSDVILQYDHVGPVLARQRNGSLVLGTDSHGAWCEAYLGGCQQARDLYESICNGLVVEMSFGFVIDDTDDNDGYTTFKDENGDYHTTITRIRRVYDVSAVGRPANPGTDIDEMRKRSYLAARIEADRKAAEHDPEPEQEEMRELTKPAFTDDELDALADALERRAKERKAQDDVPPEEEKGQRESPDEEPSQELIDETFKRRKRRMLALQLIDI
jgi:HK97 family phage prohead protease